MGEEEAPCPACCARVEVAGAVTASCSPAEVAGLLCSPSSPAAVAACSASRSGCWCRPAVQTSYNLNSDSREEKKRESEWTYPGDPLDGEGSPTLWPGAYRGRGPGLGETLGGAGGRVTRRVQGGGGRRRRLHGGVLRRPGLAGTEGGFGVWHVGLAAAAGGRRRSSSGLQSWVGVVRCGGTGTG